MYVCTKKNISRISKRRTEGGGGIEGGGKVAFSAEFIFLPFPLPRFALITTGFSYLGNGGFCCWESFSPRGVESKNFFFVFFHPFNLYGPLDREREGEGERERGKKMSAEFFLSSLDPTLWEAEGCFVDFFAAACLPPIHFMYIFDFPTRLLHTVCSMPKNALP